MEANRCFSTVNAETQEEDEHQKIVTQSLLVARQSAVNDLENLEDEAPPEDRRSETLTTTENTAGSHSPGLMPRKMNSSNRHSRIMGGNILYSSSVSEDTYNKRSSFVLNEVMLGNLPTEMRRLTLENGLLPSHVRAQPVHLLQKWIEQGNRLSKFVANDSQTSPQEQDVKALSKEDDSSTILGTIPNTEVVGPTFNMLSGQLVPLEQHQRSEARIRTIEKHLYAEKQLTVTLEEALIDLERQSNKVKAHGDAWRRKAADLELETKELRERLEQENRWPLTKSRKSGRSAKTRGTLPLSIIPGSQRS